jgi:hypothetical protein
MTVAKRNLIDAFSAAAKDRLTAAGWRKRSGDIYTYGLAGDFHAWLGLNRSTKYRPIDINPTAGLHYEPVERLMRELTRNSERSTNATLAIHLGYLTPERAIVQLRISGPEAVELAADELARLADAYVLPFAREHASVAVLEEALRDGALVVHPERELELLPALLALEGRYDEALAAIRDGLAALADREDMAAESRRQFARALERWLDARTRGDAGRVRP